MRFAHAIRSPDPPDILRSLGSFSPGCGMKTFFSSKSFRFSFFQERLYRAVSRRPGIRDVLRTERSSERGFRILTGCLLGSSGSRQIESREAGEVKL